MRHIFYKLSLQLSNGQTMPIVVATTDINRIEPLVESRKVIYNRKDYHVTGFQIVETRYPIGWTDEQYEEEVSFSDIVDEVETR